MEKSIGHGVADVETTAFDSIVQDLDMDGFLASFKFESMQAAAHLRGIHAICVANQPSVKPAGYQLLLERQRWMTIVA